MVGGLSAFAAPAAAAPFVVNDTADAPDMILNGICDAPLGAQCTLRAAIEEAEFTVGADDITFSVTGTHTLTAGALPAITEALTITGNGQGLGGTVIDGNNANRVLLVNAGSDSVAVSTLRIEDGQVTNDQGGGVRLDGGALTLSGVTVSDNHVMGTSSDLGGAGIWVTGGTLRLNDSTLSLNQSQSSATTFGGALGMSGGVLEMARTTVNDNTASQSGGIHIFANAAHKITNSTISGNQATETNAAGITLNFGSLALTNTTVAGNNSPSGTAGAGILVQSTGTQATLKNTIVSGNTSGGGPSNCSAAFGGTIADGGSNIDNGTTCGFASGSNTDPLLGPLEDNGGPTFTRALMSGSPAIDAASTDCGGIVVGGVDQRGVVRPQGPACDIGAYEAPPAPGPPSTPEAGDTDPPETTIAKGPKKKTRKKKASFVFAADESGVGFHCALDDEGFAPCSSPFEIKVKRGRHSLEVRAGDGAGNVDASPAAYEWKVKKKAPG